jgi:hypothetical protein
MWLNLRILKYCEQQWRHRNYLILISILIQWLNVEFLTVHNKGLKIAPSNPMRFALREWRSHVFLLIWSSYFFLRAAESKMRASNSSHVSKFLLQTSPFIKPTNKNLAVLGLEIQTYLGNSSELDTSSYENLFLQWTILSPLKLLNSSPISSSVYGIKMHSLNT